MKKRLTQEMRAIRFLVEIILQSVKWMYDVMYLDERLKILKQL